MYGIAGAYQPSVQASVPALVSPGHFMEANSAINTISSFARIDRTCPGRVHTVHMVRAGAPGLYDRNCDGEADRPQPASPGTGSLAVR